MTAHLHQEFLIDVCEEDDSLLPTGDKDSLLHSGTFSSSGLPEFKECNAEGINRPQEKLPLNEAVCLPEEPLIPTPPVMSEVPAVVKENCLPEEPLIPTLPVMSEVPAVVKKKKKFGFNVRKSMAWDNAFLTEEGVLDCEELSLVNKTFQKASGPSTQSNLKKPTSTLKYSKPPMMPKINVAPQRVVLNAECKEHPIIPAFNSRESTVTLSEPHLTIITGPEEAKNKANAFLSQGNMVSGKKEICTNSAQVDLTESKLSLLRRSIDKDAQAPNLFTSKGGTQLKSVNTSRPLGHNTNLEASNSFPKRTIGRLSSTSLLQTQARTGLLKLHSEGSSSKSQPALKKSSLLGTSANLTSRDKPSGLRMPSPKLGFFDTSRSGSQVAVLRERTNGYGSSGCGPGSSTVDRLDAEISGSRSSSEHSASSAKFGQRLVEASMNQNKETKNSTRIPKAPQVHGRDSEFPSLRLAPARESHRPASHGLSTADSTKRAPYARKIENVAVKGKPSISKAKGQENLSPDA